MKKRLMAVGLTVVMLWGVATPIFASSQDNDELDSAASTIEPEFNVSEEEKADYTSIDHTIYYTVSYRGEDAQTKAANLDMNRNFESYHIEMFSTNDDVRFQREDALILTTEPGLLKRNASVTINPRDYNPSSKMDEEIELPIFISDEMYNIYAEANQSGNIAIPREIGANIFFNDKADPSLRDGIIGQQSFTYCVAVVSTVDEYNSGRTKKRHNVGFSLEQKNPNYMAKYVSTSKYDDKSDVLSIAFSIGGATTASSASTTAEVIYSYQEKDQIYQNYISKGNMSAHVTYCTGNGIGFNVPDTKLSNDAAYRTCYPSLYNISCSTGWYNVGAYNGANGYLKGAMYHTYKDRFMSISPSISLHDIGFSVSGGETAEVDVGWADAILTPY